MFAGHFAAGLALKAKEPRAPTWAMLVGAAFLDLLFPLFVALGIERIHATPGIAPGMSLDFIDWSHSLLMAVVWSAVFAAFFVRRGRAVMLAAAAAVFSHFVLDWPMHPMDLALYPHAAAHAGLGLWVKWRVGWWFLEAVVVALGCAYYAVRARQVGGFGKRAWGVIAVVVLLHVVNSPWLMGKS